MKQPVLMDRLNEASIARVLYFIRAEIVRDGSEGLDHVNALLEMRGHDPEAYHVPEKTPRRFKGRSSRKQAVLSALREGPATSRQLCARIARDAPELDAEAIYPSVAGCLSELKRAGVATRGTEWRSPVWRLNALGRSSYAVDLLSH